MCGILGYIGNFEKEKLQIGLTKISHRGPDGQGVFFHNTTALGHRRLSIIDLSQNAAQPFELLDRFVITFNGEIYNYIELKKELITQGVQFKSVSDTEVLLQAYIKWGKNFVHKLNGMWAFCIYDKVENTFFLSRDRLGKKPLFYAQLKQGFVFCSEMKGIYPFLDSVSINHNNALIAINNSFSYEHTQECLINNISRFPAASYAYFKNNTLSIEHYWKPEEIKTTVPKNYNEQKELFRELFFDACKLRMRSDVTIGTALSGGLDSSAVICTMAHLNKANNVKTEQRAFVASFPNTALDETKYAKKVANYLNINANFININPLQDLDSIFKKTYLFEELFYAPVIPFEQLYKNIKQNNVTVSIDGHGADELFAGYPFDMNAALIDTLPNLSKFKKVLTAINGTTNKSKNTDYTNNLKYALLNKYPALRGFSKNANLVSKNNNLDYLNSVLFQSTFKTILPTLLRNYDRYSMMNSVEIRMPFLDYRIVEFAFSIPYSSKIKNGFSKAIVRDALADIMPTDIVYRKDKIGFNAPINNWMNTELKVWIMDLIHSADFKNSTLIDTKSVYKSITETVSKKEISFLEGSQLFNKLTPVIWEKSLSYA